MAQTDTLQNLIGLLLHQVVVNNGKRTKLLCRQFSNEQIFHNGEFVNDGQLLVDNSYALIVRVSSGESAVFSAIADDFSAGGIIYTGQDLHQRRFARAVLADQDMNLTGDNVKADVIQSLNARELLSDPDHLN